MAEPETAGAMPHIKNHASGTGVSDGWIELAVRKNNGKLLGEDVRVYVARPHFFQYQGLVSSLRSRPEIDHERNVGHRGPSNRPGTSCSGHEFCVPGLHRRIMGAFYAHNVV